MLQITIITRLEQSVIVQGSLSLSRAHATRASDGAQNSYFMELQKLFSKIMFRGRIFVDIPILSTLDK